MANEVAMEGTPLVPCARLHPPSVGHDAGVVLAALATLRAAAAPSDPDPVLAMAMLHVAARRPPAELCRYCARIANVEQERARRAVAGSPVVSAGYRSSHARIFNVIFPAFLTFRHPECIRRGSLLGVLGGADEASWVDDGQALGLAAPIHPDVARTRALVDVGAPTLHVVIAKVLSEARHPRLRGDAAALHTRGDNVRAWLRAVGRDINACDPGVAATPLLHVCAQDADDYDVTEVVDVLVAAGADVDAPGQLGLQAVSPLVAAIRARRASLALYLVDVHSARVNPVGFGAREVPLVAAIESGDHELLAALLRRGADALRLDDFPTRRPLEHARFLRDWRAVRQIERYVGLPCSVPDACGLPAATGWTSWMHDASSALRSVLVAVLAIACALCLFLLPTNAIDEP